MTVVNWLLVGYGIATSFFLCLVIFYLAHKLGKIVEDLGKLSLENSVLSSGKTQKHDLGYLYKALRMQEARQTLLKPEGNEGEGEESGGEQKQKPASNVPGKPNRVTKIKKSRETDSDYIHMVHGSMG